MTAIAGVVFDKDGTLLDFHATWDRALGAALDGIDASGARAEAAAILHYDLDSQRIGPASPFIAESNDVVVELLRGLVDLGEFERRLVQAAHDELVEMPGASSTLSQLAGRGLLLAVATNDAAWIAESQLDRLGWRERFGEIYGYDSGHGAKPGPGMVTAAVEGFGLAPAQVLMVGDSPHDLIAGREAGTVTVLIGTNPDAIPFADHRIDSLSELLDLV